MREYPDDWKEARIGELSDILTGATPSTKEPSFWGGNIRWMSSGEIHQKRIREVQGRITTSGYDSASTHMLPIGSVLIALAGQGKTRGSVAISEIVLCTNQSIGAILPSNSFNSYFLYHLLESQYLKLRMASSGDGNRGGLSKALIAGYNVILPPLPEQKRIAEVLGNVDKLIENLEKRLAKKRAIKQGAMQELLTGKKRLPGFTGEWVECCLEEYVDCLRGVSYDGSRDVFGEENENTIRLLRSNNIQNASFVDEDVQYVNRTRASEAQALRPLDILVCMANGSKDLVGKTCLFKSPFKAVYTFGAFMGCVRSKNNKTNMEYIFQLMNSSAYTQQISQALAGSSINNLRPSTLLEMKFAMPHPAEQRAIAKVLSDMDDEISVLERKLEKVKQVKQGMMQDLLTGKVRLRRPA